MKDSLILFSLCISLILVTVITTIYPLNATTDDGSAAEGTEFKPAPTKGSEKKPPTPVEIEIIELKPVPAILFEIETIKLEPSPTEKPEKTLTTPMKIEIIEPGLAPPAPLKIEVIELEPLPAKEREKALTIPPETGVLPEPPLHKVD